MSLKKISNKIANKVIMSGRVEELDKSKAVPKVSAKGKTFMNFPIKVQTSNDAHDVHNAKVFIYDTTFNGEKSKNFPAVKEFVDKATPHTLSKDGASYVSLEGSLVSNIFASPRNGKITLSAGKVENRMQYINEYKKPEFTVEIGGYIDSLEDEDINGSLTGRQKMTILSQDVFGNTIEITNIIIPQNYVNDIHNIGWEEGVTIPMVKYDYQYRTVTKKTNAKSQGIGTCAVPEESTSVFTEKVMNGGLPAFDNDSPLAFTPEFVEELKANLEEQKKTAITSAKERYPSYEIDPGPSKTVKPVSKNETVSIPKSVESVDIPFDSSNGSESEEVNDEELVDF